MNQIRPGGTEIPKHSGTGQAEGSFGIATTFIGFATVADGVVFSFG